MPDTASAAGDFHPGESHGAGASVTGLETLGVGVVTVAALYFGREVFVPMALAVLLSFALGPGVLLLRRWHINRVFAVIAVVVLAFAVIIGTGALIGSQLERLAENLPGYQTNITEKIHSLRDTTTRSGVVSRAATMLSDLGDEISPGPSRQAPRRRNPFPSRSARPTRRRSSSSGKSPGRSSNLWRRPASSSSL